MIKMSKEFFYISNIFSSSRFILTVICAYFLYNDNFLLSSVILIIIWITDLLDGYLARSRNEISELGKIIDPVADKFAIFMISLILVFKGIIPGWFFIIVILRDLLILGGGLYLRYKKHIVLQSNKMGKLAVFIIGLTFLFYFLVNIKDFNFISYHSEFTELLLYIMTLLSLVVIVFSIISYMNIFLNKIKQSKI